MSLWSNPKIWKHMDKFEYKLLTISTAHLKKSVFQSELQIKFDEWGDEGWELVKMEPINDGFWFSSTTEFFVVFRRRKKK